MLGRARPRGFALAHQDSDEDRKNLRPWTRALAMRVGPIGFLLIGRHAPPPSNG